MLVLWIQTRRLLLRQLLERFHDIILLVYTVKIRVEREDTFIDDNCNLPAKKDVI